MAARHKCRAARPRPQPTPRIPAPGPQSCTNAALKNSGGPATLRWSPRRPAHAAIQLPKDARAARAVGAGVGACGASRPGGRAARGSPLLRQGRRPSRRVCGDVRRGGVHRTGEHSYSRVPGWCAGNRPWAGPKLLCLCHCKGTRLVLCPGARARECVGSASRPVV